MEPMQIPFSDDELREIVNSSDFVTDIIFEDGYDLADAYPREFEGAIEHSFTLECTHWDIQDWEIDTEYSLFLTPLAAELEWPKSMETLSTHIVTQRMIEMRSGPVRKNIAHRVAA